LIQERLIQERTKIRPSLVSAPSAPGHCTGGPNAAVFPIARPRHVAGDRVGEMARIVGLFSPRALWLTGLCLLVACAAVTGSPTGGVQQDASVDAPSPTDAAADSSSDSARDVITSVEVGTLDMGLPPGCGNGRVDPGEACDDGNQRGGDGCSADCKAIEPDFECRDPGKACVYLVRCGDGLLGGQEQCDPPNVGMGCSATCDLEPGWVCQPPGTPADPGMPSTCHRTVCGDGKIEGTEACDDSNSIDGDGCAANCALEPD